MKIYKKSLIFTIIVISLIIITGLLLSIVGYCPVSYSYSYSSQTNTATEMESGFSTVFENYGTWIWCGILLLFFLMPAIIASLVIYLSSKQRIDNKVLEEKRSRGLRPKNKSAAVILSIFFSYWSWLYTYKINLKKFWVSLSIIFIYIISIISISVSFGFENVFMYYGTWVWFFWIILSGSIWLWALLDNSIKSSSFYINYPKGFDSEEDNLRKFVTEEKFVDKSNRESGERIFCMKCGAELPADANYCKKCGEKVR